MGIRCKVMDIISKQLNDTTLRLSTDIIDETRADSLDMVEIIVDIENEFKIEITDEEISLLRTPGDIIFHVQKLI
mgnify:CR=1 FL=1